MTIWQKRLEIKDLITENEDPENAVKVGGELAGRLRKAFLVDSDADLSDIVADLESLDMAGKFALAAFNDTLSNLYDWADGERVWLG